MNSLVKFSIDQKWALILQAVDADIDEVLRRADLPMFARSIERARSACVRGLLQPELQGRAAAPEQVQTAALPDAPLDGRGPGDGSV